MTLRETFRLVATRSLLMTVLLATALHQSRGTADEQKRISLPEGLVLKTPTVPDDVIGTVRSLNEALSRNLAPQDNAGVWLVQLFSDSVFEPELRSASLELLGIASVAKDGPRLLFLEEYVESLGTVPREKVFEEALQVQDAVQQASNRPWKSEDFPKAAAYLEANRAALDAVAAAADLPGLYIPILSPRESPQLISASRVVERRVPFVVRTLTARALLRGAGRDFTTASVDLAAGHRLAVLLAHGLPFDVSCGKANAADAFAWQGEYALLSSGVLTGAQAAAHRHALERIPRLVCAADAADRGERAILHHEVELLQRDKNSVREFFDLPEPENATDAKAARPPAIKWDLAFKRADAIQDRIVRALATADHREQNVLFDELDGVYAKWEETADDATKKIAEAIDKDPDAASRWIGETMAMSLKPMYRQRRITDDRAAVRRNLAVVGLALVAYQREHGDFPTDLADLAPRYLPVLPLDAYSDAPFGYRRESKERARVISWGPNLVDDAGKNYNDDQIIEVR